MDGIDARTATSLINACHQLQSLRWEDVAARREIDSTTPVLKLSELRALSLSGLVTFAATEDLEAPLLITMQLSGDSRYTRKWGTLPLGVRFPQLRRLDVGRAARSVANRVLLDASSAPWLKEVIAGVISEEDAIFQYLAGPENRRLKDIWLHITGLGFRTVASILSTRLRIRHQIEALRNKRLNLHLAFVEDEENSAALNGLIQCSGFITVITEPNATFRLDMDWRDNALFSNTSP